LNLNFLTFFGIVTRGDKIDFGFTLNIFKVNIFSPCAGALSFSAFSLLSHHKQLEQNLKFRWLRESFGGRIHKLQIFQFKVVALYACDNWQVGYFFFFVNFVLLISSALPARVMFLAKRFRLCFAFYPY